MLWKVAAVRQPNLIQACILLVTSGLTVLVTAILGPSLPQMQAHFADAPNAEYLVPVTMTAPMLMMAIFSVAVGTLSDRFGRLKLLVFATILYAAVGTAPLYLQSLHAILASRVALGILESTLMTISTAMIGDYWQGAQRERYMALQTTVASASGLLLNYLGGVIAEFGWRAPYAVYAISLVLAPLMMIFLWEPLRSTTARVSEAAEHDVPFRPGLIAWICLLAIIAGVVFMAVPVHFAYLFAAVGVQSLSQIGIAFALNGVGVIAGTLISGWALSRRVRVSWQIALAFLVTGGGLAGMNYATDYSMMTAAGFANGVGTGLLLPTMVTWTMRNLPASKRGFGTGAFQSCLFLGGFLNPIVIVGLEQILGARAEAVGAVGACLVVAALLASLAGLVCAPEAKQSQRAVPDSKRT